jgi:CheY-like chemotaxis protein
MTCAILVVTPHAPFGALIHQSLERSGEYIVHTCQSAEEALALCRVIPFTIAILDSDLADCPLPTLGQEIQKHCPGVRLAVFPPGNDPHSPLLAGGAFQAFLKKPFYLPSLQKAINKLLANPAQPAVQNDPAATRQPKRKKKASQPAPLAEDALLPEGQRPDPTLPSDRDGDDLPEPEPVLDLIEIERVRQSWVREALDTPPVESLSAYTAVLTPLLNIHYLRPDQINALKKWMQQASDGQGWQLVWLSIHTTYVEWTVHIPAIITPEMMANIYRQGSSDELFAQFPAFEVDNPSGDFWAPGHLLGPGERSFSRQQIYAFVASTHPTFLQLSSLIPHP